MAITIVKTRGKIQVSPYWFMAIEEPESNLHPDFQTKVADLFADAWTKFKIQFLLETHSEYMIRKIQLLISKKELDHSDVEIYYINRTKDIDKENSRVIALKPNEDGSFDREFGKGFYDEAAELSLEFYMNKGMLE